MTRFRVPPHRRVIAFTRDRRVMDSHCHVDIEGIHDVLTANHRTFRDHVYECAACGHPAHYLPTEDVWIVTRPFLVSEEP